MLPRNSFVDLPSEIGPCFFNYRVSLAVVDKHDGQVGFMMRSRPVIGGMKDVEDEDIKSVPFFNGEKCRAAVISNMKRGAYSFNNLSWRLKT